MLLLLAPKYDWSAEEKQSQKRTVKKARLALAELLSDSKEIAAGDDDDDADEGGEERKSGPALSAVAQTLLQRLLDRLVDSVQVHVRDVHVRYEDILSQPERPFTFGVTLASLHAQSVEPLEHESDDMNADGTRQQARPICKLLQLNNLAVYWNNLETASQRNWRRRARQSTPSRHEHAGDAASEQAHEDTCSVHLGKWLDPTFEIDESKSAEDYGHSDDGRRDTEERRERRVLDALEHQIARNTSPSAQPQHRYVVKPFEVTVRMTISREDSTVSVHGGEGSDTNSHVSGINSGDPMNTIGASHDQPYGSPDEALEASSAAPVSSRPAVHVDANIGIVSVVWHDSQWVSDSLISFCCCCVSFSL